MKKILGLLLTIFFMIVLVGCKSDDTKELLEEAKKDLVIVYRGDDTAESVTQDLTLVTGAKNGVTVTWQSSNTDVIANDGTVTRPQFGEGDVQVTLTATLKLDDKTVTKEFALTVKEIPKTDKEKLDEAYGDLEIEFASGDDQNNVTQDLTLPTKIGEVSISWDSNNTDAITNDGKVTPPESNEDNIVVTLTATLTIGEETRIKTFVVTVVVPQYILDVLEIKAKLQILGGLTFTDDDFELPVVAKNDVEIVWASSDSDYIEVTDEAFGDGIKAKVTRPAVGEGDKVVTLTATISKGEYSETKEFAITVKEDIPVDYITINEILTEKAKGDLVAVTDIIVLGIVEDGYYVYDETGYIYVFTKTEPQGITVGDKISLKGTYDIYYDQPEITSPTNVEVIDQDNPLPDSTEISIKAINEFDTKDKSVYAKYYTIEGTVSLEGQYDTVYLTDDEGYQVHINYKSNASVLEEFVGENIKIDVILHSFRTDENSWRMSFLGTEEDVQIVQLTDEEKVAIAKESVNLPSETDHNLDLPTSHVNGVTISWQSSHEDIINPDTGEVTLPETITDVTLTATFTLNEVTDTASYVITVLDTAIPNKSVAEAILLEDGIEARVEGLVIGNSSYGYVIYGDGAYGFVYTGSEGDATIGDLVVLKITTGSYNGLKQLKNPEIIQVKSTGNEIPEFEPGTVADLSARNITGALLTVTVSVEGEYDNVYLTDDNGDKIEVYYKSTPEYSATNGAVLKQFEGKTITIPVVMYQNGKVLFLGGLEDITVLNATVEDAVNSSDGTNLIIDEALIVANSGYGYIVYADGVFGFVYTNEVGNETIGDKVKLATTIGSFNGLVQLKNPEIIEVISSENPLPVYEEGTLSQLIDRELTGAFVVVKVTVEGKYNNVYITDGQGNKLEVYYKSTPEYEENGGAVLKAFENQIIKVPVVMYQDGKVLFLGTSEDITVATDEEKFNDAVNNFDLGITETTDNITLPDSYLDVTITWESNNTDVIANDGTVTRPAAGEDDVTVTLTATLTIGTFEQTKEFVITVKAEQETTSTLEDLIISEYYEGASNNKYLEIYNGTGADVDLSEYTIERYTNGGTTPTVITLEGTLTAGDVFVIANSSSDIQAILDAADMLSGNISHNGDDSYVLKHNDVIIDSFGRVGEDPGSKWESNGVATADMVLVRKSTITSGDTVIDDEFDPSVEWDAYDVETLDYLGNHTIG